MHLPLVELTALFPGRTPVSVRKARVRLKKGQSIAESSPSQASGVSTFIYPLSGPAKMPASRPPTLNRTRQIITCLAENIFGGWCHSVSS